MQDPGRIVAAFASRSFPKPTGWLGQCPGLDGKSGDTTGEVLENRAALASKLLCVA